MNVTCRLAAKTGGTSQMHRRTHEADFSCLTVVVNWYLYSCGVTITRTGRRR